MDSRPSEPETRVGAPRDRREVSIASLQMAGSRYACFRGEEPGRDALAGLARSLDDLGQLTPVVAHELEAGALHLVDGFARAQAAADLGWTKLDCAVLGSETPLERVIGLVVSVRRATLIANAVARARLVALATHEGLGDRELRDWLLPSLGLQGHQSVLRRCLAISELPEPVADFCAAKGFSVKQCAHLAGHPRELLEAVFSWRDRINLTASLAEALLEDLGDYLRARSMTPAQLAEVEEIDAVLASGDNPQRAARELRDRVRALRAPVLTGANRRMDATVASLGLPACVRVTWDRSLERHELGIHVALQDPHEWPEALASLQRAEVERSVTALFEEL